MKGPIILLGTVLMISWNPFKKAKAAEPVRTITAEQHLAASAPFNPDNPFPWVGFRNLTPQVIASLDDKHLYRAITDHFQLRTQEAHSSGQTLSRDSFTREVLLLYAVWTLEAEVRNGAFTQFFHNQSNQTVQDAVEGLKLIQAECSLGVLRGAIGVFSYHYPKLQPLLAQYDIVRPGNEPKSETATHDFHVCQQDLDEQRVKFMRSMLGNQLEVRNGG